MAGSSFFEQGDLLSEARASIAAADAAMAQAISQVALAASQVTLASQNATNAANSASIASTAASQAAQAAGTAQDAAAIAAQVQSGTAVVKVDGTTITKASDGTISAAAGTVKVDGTTVLKGLDGTLSAVTTPVKVDGSTILKATDGTLSATAAPTKVDGTSITKSTDGTLSVNTVSPGNLPVASTITDASLVIMGTGAARADALKAYVLPTFLSTHELTTGPGLADADELDVFSTATNGSAKYTMAQLVAYMAAKLGSTGSTGNTGGSTGGTGNTGGGTTTPIPTPTGLPTVTWTEPPTYAAAKFGNGLKTGRGTAQITTVANSSGGADLVMNAWVNFGSAATYPYRDVFTISVSGNAYGFNIGDNLDLRAGGSTSHSYKAFDGVPHYVQVVLTSTASAGWLRVYYDGSSIYDGAVAAIVPGSVATLLIDRNALAADAYVDDVEILNSATGLSTASPTVAAARKSITNVIYPLDSSAVGI